MRWAKKTGVKLFQLSFSTDPVEKVKFFDWIPQSETQSTKVESKKPFFDCNKKGRFGLKSKKAVFD